MFLSFIYLKCTIYLTEYIIDSGQNIYACGSNSSNW